MALACANPGQAAPETISSSYTSTAPKACRMIGKPNEEDGSTTRVCPGKSGLVVLINEGDLREVVSVGRNRAAAAKEPAARAWFGPFSSTGDTVEWRTAGSKPFAIIQRWQIADNSEQDKRGGPVSRAMLAVTRLPPGDVCHVAYVDVAANPDANVLARQAADDFARDFKCGTDQVKTIGQSGRSTSLTKR
ncbi:hypothetical protein CK489_34200 [Bradyrhizobium sp. UFLA03-84]|uniref:hypothetical protein n=1 Tax=Bradyrhizobium sp. UFLA03-84 TaxID=418599 RepID=UPI000BADF710|nr:hypothetical protein [Bradyrhizobium sp. UFLA03-84]PAY04297.1 hypothetical protein CK489_34200 [Bradyrhizobium sp. UFLA03-84]